MIKGTRRVDKLKPRAHSSPCFLIKVTQCFLNGLYIAATMQTDRVKNHNSDIILIFPHLRRNKGPFAVQTWLFPGGVSANENFHFVTRRALTSSNSWNTAEPVEKGRRKSVNRKAVKLQILSTLVHYCNRSPSS